LDAVVSFSAQIAPRLTAAACGASFFVFAPAAFAQGLEPQPTPPSAAPGAPSPRSDATSGDVVVLRDGSRIGGTLIRQEPGKFVVIRQPDGREITLSWDDVKRVEAAAPTVAPAPAPAVPPAGPQGPVRGPEGTQTQTQLEGGGLGLSSRTTFAEAEAKRQAWLKRGGGIVSFAVRGQGFFMMTKPFDLPYGDSVTGIEQRGYRGYGGGGGAGFRVNFMNLNLPDPAAGNSWSAFKVGTGIDLAFAYIGFPVPKIETSTSYTTVGNTTVPSVAVSYGTHYEGTSVMQLNVPLNLGYQWGIGSFDGAQWRGVSLGVSYAPSLNVTKVKDGDPTTGFNYAGAELSLQILDKNGPLAADATEAHGEIFVFVLPPVGDLPLLVNVGGGAVWY
jgi:hypothetical protein